LTDIGSPLLRKPALHLQKQVHGALTKLI